MHINQLLSEDFSPSQDSTRKIAFNDLNTLQVRTLNRLANGEIDVDTVGEKEFDILTDLQDIGLLDLDFELTPSGQSIVAIAQRVGGSAELHAARERQKAINNFDGRDAQAAFDARTDDGDEEEYVNGTDFDDEDDDGVDTDFPPRIR